MAALAALGCTMSSEVRRQADRRRNARQPWRAWYNSPRWRKRRAKQLFKVPWCEPCRSLGLSRPAKVANHKIPHRGDPHLFWNGPLESCCKPCHDAAIQRAELEGFRRDVDDEGWPMDPAHPFNKLKDRA